MQEADELHDEHPLQPLPGEDGASRVLGEDARRVRMPAPWRQHGPCDGWAAVQPAAAARELVRGSRCDWDELPEPAQGNSTAVV